MFRILAEVYIVCSTNDHHDDHGANAVENGTQLVWPRQWQWSTSRPGWQVVACGCLQSDIDYCSWRSTAHALQGTKQETHSQETHSQETDSKLFFLSSQIDEMSRILQKSGKVVKRGKQLMSSYLTICKPAQSTPGEGWFWYMPMFTISWFTSCTGWG